MLGNKQCIYFFFQIEHSQSEDEQPVEETDDDEEGDDEEDIYQLDLPSAELCADYWQIHKMVKVLKKKITFLFCCCCLN